MLCATSLRRVAPALAAALLLTAADPARACSVCGCGDPLLLSSDPAALSGQLRVQLDSEYLRMRAASEDQPGAQDALTQWSVRLNAAWRPLDALTLSGTLPGGDWSVVGPVIEEESAEALRRLKAVLEAGAGTDEPGKP